MNFLVIGGAGYIGSHFVRRSQELGHTCVVFDDLSRGHRNALSSETRFVQGSILDFQALFEVLSRENFDCILHFAAFALVGESMQNPDLYYKNNVEGVQTLLRVLVRLKYNKSLVFSSSCAVFGTPSELPITEVAPKNPISPYGRSKLVAEYLIEDYARVSDFKAVALRYFNACGAHPSAEIGEDHEPETHLLPNIIKSCLNGKEVVLFGDDFQTADGTCVRDYIHVMDLVDAHIKTALMLDQANSHYFDAIHLGTGKGYSNLEVLKACEKVLQKKIDWRFGPRRAGDPPELIADNRKASTVLQFEPQFSELEEIVKSAWAWHQSHPLGFKTLR